jgi:hypothetical protein
MRGLKFTMPKETSRQSRKETDFRNVPYMSMPLDGFIAGPKNEAPDNGPR